MKKKFSGKTEEESRGVLQKRHPRRGTILGVRLVYERSSSFVLDLQVQEEGVSCRGQPGARSNPFLEVERIKLV